MDLPLENIGQNPTVLFIYVSNDSKLKIEMFITFFEDVGTDKLRLQPNL